MEVINVIQPFYWPVPVALSCTKDGGLFPAAVKNSYYGVFEKLNHIVIHLCIAL